MSNTPQLRRKVVPVTTFRISEAAAVLGVSADTVRRLVDGAGSPRTATRTAIA